MMKWSLSLSLVVALTAASAVAQTSAPRLLPDEVRTRVTEQVARGEYPSMVILVTDGKSDDIAAFGKASASKDADGKTLYEIGSVSKTFTALLLADAVSRGEVTLDTPAEKLLGFALPKKDQKAITLLDLATQTSGLPRLPSNLFPKNEADPYASYTADDLHTFLASHELQFAPGSHYEYSNLGFGVLGEALARRAAKSYAALVAERITTPLSMRDTSVDVPVAQMAQGHDGSGAATSAWNLGVFAGAGALKSNAQDLSRYLHALMQPSTAGALEKALRLVTQPQRDTVDHDHRIALAWQLEKRGDREVVWHNGGTGGFASFVGFTRKGDRGVIVLTNISRDVTQLGLSILAPVEPKKLTEVTLPAEGFNDYVGRYRLAPNFELAVRADKGQLFVQATGQPELPVFASAKDEFFYKVVDAQLSFHRDAKGHVDSLVLHQNGQHLPGPRVSEAAPLKAQRQRVQLPATLLADYVGRYQVAPSFALEVTVAGDQLYVQATAQPRFPLYASAKDEFFLEVVDAQLSFQRGASGTVEAVVLHQNGQDIRGNRAK